MFSLLILWNLISLYGGSQSRLGVDAIGRHFVPLKSVRTLALPFPPLLAIGFWCCYSYIVFTDSRWLSARISLYINLTTPWLILIVNTQSVINGCAPYTCSYSQKNFKCVSILASYINLSIMHSIDLCLVRQSLSQLRLAPNRPCMSLVANNIIGWRIYNNYYWFPMGGSSGCGSTHSGCDIIYCQIREGCASVTVSILSR